MIHSLQEHDDGSSEATDRAVRLQRALVLSLATHCERLPGGDRGPIAGQLVEELHRLESLVARER